MYVFKNMLGQIAMKNETASKKLMVAAQAEDQQAVIDGLKPWQHDAKTVINHINWIRANWLRDELGYGHGFALPCANTATFVI